MLTPQNPTGGDLPELDQLFSDWMYGQLRQLDDQARAYLSEHPDEPGVILEPSVVHPETGESIRLGPFAYTRKDFGL